MPVHRTPFSIFYSHKYPNAHESKLQIKANSIHSGLFGSCQAFDQIRFFLFVRRAVFSENVMKP